MLHGRSLFGIVLQGILPGLDGTLAVLGTLLHLCQGDEAVGQVLLDIGFLPRADLLIDPYGRLAGINGPLDALCPPIRLGQGQISCPEQGLGLCILGGIALHPVYAQGFQGGVNGLPAVPFLILWRDIHVGHHAGGYGQILVAAGQGQGLAELQGGLKPLPSGIQSSRAVLRPVFDISHHEVSHPQVHLGLGIVLRGAVQSEEGKSLPCRLQCLDAVGSGLLPPPQGQIDRGQIVLSGGIEPGMLISGIDPGCLAVGIKSQPAQLQKLVLSRSFIRRPFFSCPFLSRPFFTRPFLSHPFFSHFPAELKIPFTILSRPEIRLPPGRLWIPPRLRLHHFPVLPCLRFLRQGKVGVSQAVLQRGIGQWLLFPADAGEGLLAGKKGIAAVFLSLLHLGEGEIGYGQAVLHCRIPCRIAILGIGGQSFPAGSHCFSTAISLIGGIACRLGQYEIGSGQIDLGGGTIKQLILGAVDAQSGQSSSYG